VFDRVTADTWRATISSDSIAQGDTPNFILRAEDTATNSVVEDSGGQGFEYQISGVANTPPTVRIQFPDTGAYLGGDIPGTFVVTDAEDVSGTATVEFDTSGAGSNWQSAPLAIGDTSVSMTSEGDTNNFTWDSLADVGNVKRDTPVRIRIKVYDGTDTGSYDTSPEFIVDNRAPPKVTDLSGTAGVAPDPDTGVFLSWSFSDTDVSLFNIYRVQGTSDTSGAVLLDTAPVAPDTITYRDSSVTYGDSFFYYTTAVDTAGNESDSSSVASAPHVSFVKNDNADSLHRPGDTIIYRISYVSDGFAPAQQIQLVDALPDSTTFVDTATVDSGPSATVEYSRDGGSTWSGSPSPRDSVTHVRWTVTTDQDPLPPDDNTGQVRFKVVID
jgi:uncharacterized repeat protein (TIGR01451 family)